MTELVTILIPHYKTLELTKLCLRSLRKYTDLSKVKILVIDNGSKDESTDYLRTIKWITLIERDVLPDETPPQAHANALDLGLESVITPYVLSTHTDTIVCNENWLNFLLGKIEADTNIAGIGSWKLEHKVLFKRLAKKIEGLWQAYIWYPLTQQNEGHIEGRGKKLLLPP